MRGTKAVWVFTIISVLCFEVTLLQSATDFSWWNFESEFFWGLEKFTFFIINPISLIVCIVLSLKLIYRKKSLIYLISIAIPVLSVGLSIYLFWARVIVAIIS